MNTESSFASHSLYESPGSLGWSLPISQFYLFVPFVCIFLYLESMVLVLSELGFHCKAWMLPPPLTLSWLYLPRSEETDLPWVSLRHKGQCVSVWHASDVSGGFRLLSFWCCCPFSYLSVALSSRAPLAG